MTKKIRNFIVKAGITGVLMASLVSVTNVKSVHASDNDWYYRMYMLEHNDDYKKYEKLYSVVFKETSKELAKNKYAQIMFGDTDIQTLVDQIVTQLWHDGVNSPEKYEEWKKKHDGKTAGEEYLFKYTKEWEKYYKMSNKDYPYYLGYLGYMNPEQAYRLMKEYEQKEKNEAATYQDAAKKLIEQQQNEQAKIIEQYKKVMLK